ncbi:response regulator transcription factor [Phenylobacterium deserti]|uniref:DNA-binding response regulator n=1 Tax=Phenylobacterium deserti TaxID=1914756 RepID=A0A328AH82_9CAUL|nr:response regulator transcription factor [Phenylobacterium deserti]RAK52724.1 DNA-binding response regulator [Phenylobacterium deserti]
MTGGVVYIVDDDVALCEGLDALIRSVGLRTRCFASVAAFVEAEREEVAGCIVLDVRLPGMSGLDFQSNLQRFDIRLPVIVITGFADVPMSVRAMKAGAVDFLTKPFRDQDLLDSIAMALARDAERRAAEGNLAEIRSRYETLTPREQQVMREVVAGRLNKQVAGDLQLSEVTVKLHRGSLMRKMGVRSLADLVRCAELLKLA